MYVIIPHPTEPPTAVTSCSPSDERHLLPHPTPPHPEPAIGGIFDPFYHPSQLPTVTRCARCVMRDRRGKSRSISPAFVFEVNVMLALLCTPALAVHNFRPTLLRPRAPHLRTAALRPACIALDPDPDLRLYSRSVTRTTDERGSVTSVGA